MGGRRPPPFEGTSVSETITGLITYDLRVPTSRELDGSDAMNPDPDYSAAYVVVRTSSGAEGCGFAFTIGRGNDVMTAAIDALAPLITGLPVPRASDGLGDLWRRLVHDSHLRWLGPEKGVIHMAIGAVVNAVWDLYAKREGKPLWKLLVDLSPEQIVDLVDFRYLSDALTRDEALAILTSAAGGKVAREQELREDGFPAYTTSAGWLGYPDAKVRRLVGEALADGFTHLKLKVGADPADDLRRVRMVREQVGPDVLLSVDANQRWDVGEAIEAIGALAPAGLYWAEEPTSPDDVLGHLAIAQAVAPVRVASGEHGANRVLFKQLLASGAIGVCQIDACRVAGVNENLAILLLAAKFGVPVCPHAGGVGLCELVQHLAMFDFVAVSGSTDGRWIEYVDHLHEMFADPVRLERARYRVPERPGTGAEIRAEAIARYHYPDGPEWSDAARPG